MAASDTLATLKTIFVAKRILQPVYIIVFINALVFVMVISKIVTTEEGMYYALAFAVGKSLGVLFGGIIENKMALGIMEANIFFNNKVKMINTADGLREEGYSVNTYDAHGFTGRKRYIVEVTLRRKSLSNLKKILKGEEDEDPTMTIKEVNNVHGKIRNSI